MTTRILPLQGKILKAIYVVRKSDRDDEILFETKDGERYVMYHSQDCCEDVYIEDIIGDLQDLVGCKLLKATEEVSGEELAVDEDDESWTWTFYKFSTIKGDVDIRWYGTSNGYYSEEATVGDCDDTDWADNIIDNATELYLSRCYRLGEM